MPPAKPYPGDQYILDLIAKQGYVKKDVNGNYILAQGVNIDTLSNDNIVTAVNSTIVKSHENKIFARNTEVWNVNGTTSTGADHIINKPSLIVTGGDGANYLNVDGDGCTVGGYSSRTAGTNCKNMGWFGIAFGQNIIIGRQNEAGLWVANEFRNSTGIGKNIIIQGSDITVIGDGTGLPPFTVPGVYNLNEK